MTKVEARLRAVPESDVEGRIAALAPWFHNMKLGGIWTAPDHFLGDYPAPNSGDSRQRYRTFEGSRFSTSVATQASIPSR